MSGDGDTSTSSDSSYEYEEEGDNIQSLKKAGKESSCSKIVKASKRKVATYSHAR
ncbi:hypothetical protein ACP4OV_028068 [Aristida adscensionis]